MLILSGCFILFALSIIFLVLTSSLYGQGLYIVLWVCAFLFVPAMVTAGLSLHFARKSIMYDKLDKRETSTKQRILLWMSFVLFLACIIPFLAMINYG